VIAHGSKTFREAGRSALVAGRMCKGAIEVVDDGHPLCRDARPLGRTFSRDLTLEALAQVVEVGHRSQQPSVVEC
jgi:hypothetical protein